MAPTVKLLDGEREVGHFQVSLLIDSQGRRPDEDEWSLEGDCEEDIFALQERLGVESCSVYVAWRSGISSAYRQRGYGVLLYEFMLDNLRATLGHEVILVPEACLEDGNTSDDARRVWESIQKRRVSYGNAVSSRRVDRVEP